MLIKPQVPLHLRSNVSFLPDQSICHLFLSYKFLFYKFVEALESVMCDVIKIVYYPSLFWGVPLPLLLSSLIFRHVLWRHTWQFPALLFWLVKKLPAFHGKIQWRVSEPGPANPWGRARIQVDIRVPNHSIIHFTTSLRHVLHRYPKFYNKFSYSLAK